MLILRRFISLQAKKASISKIDVSFKTSSKFPVYTSPFVFALQRLKLISAVGACGSFLSAPILALASGENSAALAASIAILLTGTGSTAALNWYIRPYVTRISLVNKSLKEFDTPKDEYGDIEPEKLRQFQDYELEIEKLTFFGGLKTESVKIGSLKASQKWRPLALWEGDNGEDYYVHLELFDDPSKQALVEAIDRSKNHL